MVEPKYQKPPESVPMRNVEGWARRSDVREVRDPDDIDQHPIAPPPAGQIAQRMGAFMIETVNAVQANQIARYARDTGLHNGVVVIDGKPIRWAKADFYADRGYGAQLPGLSTPPPAEAWLSDMPATRPRTPPPLKTTRPKATAAERPKAPSTTRRDELMPVSATALQRLRKLFRPS